MKTGKGILKAKLMILISLWLPRIAVAEGIETERIIEDIIITATRTEVPRRESPQQVEVVSRRALEAAGNNVTAALDVVPGLILNRTGGGAMAALPSIRGGNPGEVLVLLDGHRLNNQQSGWFNLSDLPLNGVLVDRVEILEGASSALYGPEATGGVINVVSRDPAAAPAVDMALYGGGMDTFGGWAAVSGNWGPCAMTASWGKEKSQGDRDNSDYDQEKSTIKVDLPWRDFNFGFSLHILGKEAGSPGPTVFPSRKARQRDAARYGSFLARYSPSPKMTFDVSGFWNGAFRSFEDPDIFVNSRHNTRTAGGLVGANIAAGAWGRLSTGFEAVWDEVDSSNDGQHSLARQGIYIQDELNVGGGVAAVIGLRWDGYRVFDDQFSPRLSLIYTIAPGATARASISRGFRTPTFDDLYWNDPWMKGNPDLEPEKSWNYEFGGSLSQDALSADLSFFRRDVADLILWRDADGDWVYAPENIASARFLGFTASAGAALPAGQKINASYTYIDPKDADKDRVIAGKAKHQVKMDYTISSSWINAALAVAWIDRYPAPNLSDTAYWTARMTVGKTMALPGYGKLDLSLTVDNVLNESYEVSPGYPMPGRNIILMTEWRF